MTLAGLLHRMRRHHDNTPTPTTRIQLLGVSRDALRLANQSWTRAHSTPDIASVYETLGQLTGLVAAIDDTVQLLHGDIDAQISHGRLVALEGPFIGDARAATAAAKLWLAKAENLSRQTKITIENTHIAISGLAAAPGQNRNP